MLNEHATETARKAPPDAKVDEGTAHATPRAAYVRPLPQHRLKQRKKWISVASIEKAKAERQRKAAEAAATARRAEEKRQRVAAEAERQRKVAEAAAAARKAEEARQRLAAEAARKAEAERQRQAAEAAAAARKAEEERLRIAAELAQKAEAARIAKEAVEAKARAHQETRRRTLGLTVTPEDGARFLARGRALLTSGDVTSARLFLERASNAGLADAAMELAETYDPAMVTRLSAVGLVGDREQARAWYMRAQALGSSAAAERLKGIVGQ